MKNPIDSSPASSASPNPSERIDTADAASIDQWSRKLDVTEAQIKEAVAAVGANASDVELHLRGSRSRTNADRVARAVRIGEA